MKTRKNALVWEKAVAYQQTEARVPFPESVRIGIGFPAHQSKTEMTLTFGAPTHCERSEREFYLPHYGISESALGYPDGSIGPRIVLGCFGLSGLVGIYGFTWFSRRRADRVLVEGRGG
jgi:hypothetical protein